MTEKFCVKKLNFKTYTLKNSIHHPDPFTKSIIPEDYDLAITIRKALLKNPDINKWEVNVTADNGAVYLNGTVDSYFERMVAEDMC